MSFVISAFGLGARLVHVVLGSLLIWPHGPAEWSVWFPDLEDHGHAVLNVVVDVAVDDPASSVVHRDPEDHISIGWYLDDVLEHWVVEVAWEKALFVHIHDSVSVDGLVLVELTHANNVVPAAVHVDGVGHCFAFFHVDQNNFKPVFFTCEVKIKIWLFDDMRAVTFEGFVLVGRLLDSAGFCVWHVTRALRL